MTLKWKFLLILAVAFPYYKIATWKFLLATAVIFFIYKKFHPTDYKERLGVNFTKAQLPWAIALCLFCMVFTETSIQHLIQGSSFQKTSPVLFGFWFLQPLAQSLNEEMLMRSLFIKWLRTNLKLRKWQLNLLMAGIFSGLHFLFCSVLYQTNLDPKAGLVLFLATIAMNGMYFETRNILFSWAVHFGVNFSFFGGTYSEGARLLNDAEKFNLVYGDAAAVWASLIFLAVTLLWIGIRRKPWATSG